MKISINQSPVYYLPFLKGKYTVAPGLKPIEKAEELDKLVFQLDNEFEYFRKNKEACRAENIHKYYQKARYNPELEKAVNFYLIKQLSKEHPELFINTEHGDRAILQCLHTGEMIQYSEEGELIGESPYIDLFDALNCQVQEDIAVWQLADDDDWLAAVHLCAPNHWSAEEKIGQNFDFVHEVIPGMEKIRRHYMGMLDSVVKKGPYIRFGWGVSTDIKLNHHPDPAPGYSQELWYGRKFDPDFPMLFTRTERQCLVGIPEHNAFIFTIRSYFADVSKMDEPTLQALKSALLSMSAETLVYKGLDDKREEIIAWLDELMG
ncbi:DUF3445 domain-containing protein [Flammeovirgaceae bacterium SG7u.111]|nr:DUF3445 domain-containing protein [Flammeovirgaceae bacterium SG7u.132]WPO34209.1 DUF3445 domain-containing protein [Flammeovirgaceae bacterium SG7u.111]